MKVGGTHIACTAFGTLRMYAQRLLLGFYCLGSRWPAGFRGGFVMAQRMVRLFPNWRWHLGSPIHHIAILINFAHVTIERISIDATMYG